MLASVHIQPQAATVDPQTNSLEVRDLRREDRDWARAFLVERLGSTRVVTRGVLHEADTLPGFVALDDRVRSALLTYHVANRQLEVVTLHAARPGLGMGSCLLAAARDKAQAAACRRLWLITTNDNEPAMRFYERRGLRLVAVHRGAIAESRKLKPEIPLFGIGGMPIRDEVEFELRLEGAPDDLAWY